MTKSIKTIVIVLAVILAVVLVVFFKAEIGAVFATMIGGLAAFKAKLFNSSKVNVEEQMAQVDHEHSIKREEWDRVKDEYDSKFEALKAKMEYIDYKTARIRQEILDVDQQEHEALAKNKTLTEEEILTRLLN
ncbi:hypothetical protein [Reichenbachiella sp.]|uniref:hypothetical protein n=1 Tax=Reichenbachiella sp. TaxID=2184521 RepID=UPI003BB0202C